MASRSSSIPPPGKSAPKNYIHVVGLPRSTMMVTDPRVPPSKAVAEISSDFAKKLSEGVRSWFGVQANVPSLPRVYRELTINHESTDQLLWKSDEHLTPEYVLLYDLPKETDHACKKIANLGHGENSRQTLEQLQEMGEEKKIEVGQEKRKKKTRKLKAKGKPVSEKTEPEVEMRDEVEKDAIIEGLQLEVQRHREATAFAQTLVLKATRKINCLARRTLLDDARTKLYETYSAIPRGRLVIRNCYVDKDYEKELRAIVEEVLSVLTGDHAEVLREAEIRMIIDGREGTIRKDGNNAAHGNHVDISDAIQDSVLNGVQTQTLGSINRFVEMKD